MGMFDSIAQAPTPMGQTPNASAQQQPMNAFKQKMQQRANPMMQGRPAMGGGMRQPSMSQTPNPMTGARPAINSLAKGAGSGGSAQQIAAKQLAQKNQQAAAQGGAIGGSYNQLLSAHPELQQMRQTGQAAGQNMSWMDQPGAIRMPDPNNQILSAVNKPQYGLQDVASRYAQEQQPIQQTPMQAAAEQMRGYEGPDLGSQDPRELARMGQIAGAGEGQPNLMNAPYGGEQPGSNGFQSMMENMQGQRPDVMPRGGLGPSFMEQAAPIQMDENGLEARRGAR